MPDTLPDMPIRALLPAILESLAAHPRLVLEAPPGAGKTTQVPPALLDATWLGGRQIVLLEPRRIAARAAATFMATQRGEAVGQSVGYRIRFESRVSDATRILVVTEGILTRMLQDDPELHGIGAIVFDEFHERHLAGDLGAVLALDVQASLRHDLRLVVMSATLHDSRIAQGTPLDGSALKTGTHGEKSPWFDAPVLRSEGRAFPVHIEYPAARRDATLASQVQQSVQAALDATDGDVLVFLPGRREIASVQRALAQRLSPHVAFHPLPSGEGAPQGRVRVRDHARNPDPHPQPLSQGERGEKLEVLQLHGELSLAEQQAALAPAESGRRRIILATNVAESSITVPGVRAVVDAGLAREPRFDPNSGFTRLATVNISQASAHQRAGRAGRVAPGKAYRLWPESRRLDPSRTPEIAQTELSGLALELGAWGVGADASALHWLDPPPTGALAQARELLLRLGAMDADLHITAQGREMLRLGSSPRLAAAALRAPDTLRALVADLLALLESRSPLRGGFNDDMRARVDVLHRFRDAGVRAVTGADTGALAAIEHTSRGWRKRLGVRHGASGTPDASTIGNLLLHAFPDRAARQDTNDPRRYLLANGRGVRLHDDSALFAETWLVVIEARFDVRDSLVLAAAPFDAALLARDYASRIVHERVVRQNARGVVEAFEEERFDAIVLSQRAVPVASDDALPALLVTLRANGLDSLPWSDTTRRLRTRITWLRNVMPDADLPDVSDTALLDSLETWLAPRLAGKRKLDALSSGELSDAFAALLNHRQRKLIRDSAPEAITVPSGISRKLDYAAACTEGNASPVLAVKLQELFGLSETPRVAGGRVPVTLHLLSPAGRPIQVTQDLRGFWDRTYPEVRRELKGRYPRHPWPDDPWNATPTHRPKPRR